MIKLIYCVLTASVCLHVVLETCLRWKVRRVVHGTFAYGGDAGVGTRLTPATAKYKGTSYA